MKEGPELREKKRQRSAYNSVRVVTFCLYIVVVMLVRRNKFFSLRNIEQTNFSRCASKRYMTHKARRDEVPHVVRIIQALFKLQRFSHISYPASTPAFETHFRFDSSCSAFELLLPVYQWIVTEMMPKGFITYFCHCYECSKSFPLKSISPSSIRHFFVGFFVLFFPHCQFKMYSLFFGSHFQRELKMQNKIVKLKSWNGLRMYMKLLLISCWCDASANIWQWN